MLTHGIGGSADNYLVETIKNIKINPKEAKQDVHYLLFHLYSHALELEPFLPETSDKIKKFINDNKKAMDLLSKQ